MAEDFKHDLAIIEPMVSVHLDEQTGSPNRVLIKTELLGRSGQKAQRTGKYLRLRMTPATAMQLLVLLKAAQQKHNIADPPGSTMQIPVPPTSDQH